MFYLLYLLYTCLGFFWLFCRWGIGYRFSLFTHTFFMHVSWVGP